MLLAYSYVGSVLRLAACEITVFWLPTKKRKEKTKKKIKKQKYMIRNNSIYKNPYI